LFAPQGSIMQGHTAADVDSGLRDMCFDDMFKVISVPIPIAKLTRLVVRQTSQPLNKGIPFAYGKDLPGHPLPIAYLTSIGLVA